MFLRREQIREKILRWLIARLDKKKDEIQIGREVRAMKKMKKVTPPYMMNRELSWLKFNERVLNEAGNPRVPLAERLTFASIYQSNLDEFYMVRVGTLMDQMQSSEEVRENKTNMTSEIGRASCRERV